MNRAEAQSCALIMQPQMDQGQIELRKWLGKQPEADVVALIGNMARMTNSSVANEAIIGYFALYGIGVSLREVEDENP